MLLGSGWLPTSTDKSWRLGQVDYLHRVIQTSPARLAEAMELFRAWASEKGLVPREPEYVARQPGRPALRFSESGDPAIETMYRTHWISGALPENKRERLLEKASRAPELAVIQPLNDD